MSHRVLSPEQFANYTNSHRRLAKAVSWQGILSRNETLSAFVAHRQGDHRYGGSEAVVHYGGATKLIQDAVRNRHKVPK